jgi:hypothetical protein
MTKEQAPPTSFQDLIGKFIIFTDFETECTSAGEAVSIIGDNFYMKRISPPGCQSPLRSFFLLSFDFMCFNSGTVDIFDNKEDLDAMFSDVETKGDNVTSLNGKRKK